MRIKNSTISDFLMFMQHKQSGSENTIKNYERYLHRFKKFLQETSQNDLNTKVFEEYIQWLSELRVNDGVHAETKALNTKTQNYHLSALRSFVKFCEDRGNACDDYANIKLHNISRAACTKALSGEDLDAILSSITLHDVKSLRDKAILSVLVHTDLRTSELCKLDRDSFSTKKCSLKIPQKNGLYTEFSIPFSVCETIMQYIALRKDHSPALFSNNGKRLSASGDTRLGVRSVERIVQYYAKKVGIQTLVTPHTLRISRK